MSSLIVPFALKDTSSLIEKLLPVQKISAEVYRERKAGAGQTLTSLGSYWKGRKPLILNKACVLGCLLPATKNLRRDLEIFEKLMAMDDESFVVRARRPRPIEILERLSIGCIEDYFEAAPQGVLPRSAPIDFSKPAYREVEIAWRSDLSEMDRRRLEAQLLPKMSYRERVESAKRPEEAIGLVHDHIWESVNAHLGTEARSFPELLEQLGIMRFGHRPRIADTFCGSGQIPFEAARLGCDVYASDLSPVACMLTWGAFHIVGGARDAILKLQQAQAELVNRILKEIDRLGIECDDHGWRAKSYLYCLEVRCPQSGWMVPLLPSRIVSVSGKKFAELTPDREAKCYEIIIRPAMSDAEFTEAAKGTIRSDGRGQDPYLVHIVDGVEYRTKISTLRGDYRNPDGSTGNRLRLWEKQDFTPRLGDIFQERLYAIHWMRPKAKGKKFDYEFRSVTREDLKRERIVEEFLAGHLQRWQAKGWIPDMRIEPGAKTDEPIRTRGWTHWHHLFPPRHLLLLGLLRRASNDAVMGLLFSRILDYTSKLCRWTTSAAATGEEGKGKRTGGASDNPSNVFYNQALNPFFNYGCRASVPLLQFFVDPLSSSPISGRNEVQCQSASDIDHENDIYITDPPYGDAVSYEEILEFFIAWLRKNPPSEFANWVWDSRRALAIKGEGEDFRRGMVAAYKRMSQLMPDNGIQVIMFTHQSGSIWADMANIVWASGLRVTAAWYVVTETNSPLREGSYVKGTVLLVLRKREKHLKTSKDDLAWEIQEEVEEQVRSLTGLNQEAKGLYRDENVFEEADLQMAGYAAALRVLTRYSIINGRDMTTEAIRPRVKGETTFVDDLIEFAVGVANQCLVPQGIEKAYWDRLTAAERFYLKLIDMEAKGLKTLDNYQNFAKALKVKDFRPLMGSQKANSARLKSAVELGRSEMSEGSELYGTVLRSVLYAMTELVKDVDANEVMAHLSFNVPNYYDTTQRELVAVFANYLANKLEGLRPEEASAARVLRELVRNQRL